MGELVPVCQYIAPMGEEAISKVRLLESRILELPQVIIDTDHLIHGGIYSRTVFIPKGVVITGVLVKIATQVIVSGDVMVYVDGEPLHLVGYRVVPASAGRKQAFLANEDSWLTMIFPSEERLVAKIEEQFTEEEGMLASRRDVENNRIMVTGE